MGTRGKEHASNKGENDEESVDGEGREEKPKTVGIMKLFKYATIVEMLYMFLGTCFAVLTGWVQT